MHSEPTGLSIQVSESIVPVFSVTELEGNFTMAPDNTDVYALLREQLPLSIALQDIAGKLQDLLQGTWKYGSAGLHKYILQNPVFTRSGDLVVELLPQTSTSTNTSPAGREPRKVKSIPGRPSTHSVPYMHS